MSSVRMCDNCGTIFSEASGGWQTGTIITVTEEGDTIRVVQDRCPDCAVGGKDKKKPLPKLAAAASTEISNT